MKKTFFRSAIGLLALSTSLAGCGGDDTGGAVAVTPPPPPPVANLSFARCLSQMVGGRSVQDILIPDQLELDLSQPAGFPNGRDLDDPVIDLVLAALFLDLRVNPATTLVGVPLNPNVFDQPLRTTFPFYAAPIGTPPLSPTTGTNFNFRTGPVSGYIRVDRAGAPAISTAVILGNNKLTYNDSSTAVDATGANVPFIAEGYQQLTNALNDDLRGLGLTPCAS